MADFFQDERRSADPNPAAQLDPKVILWIAAIVLGLIGYLVACWYIGGHRTVHLLSGVGQEYTVTIDGTEHTVTTTHRPIELAEGTHEIVITGPIGPAVGTGESEQPLADALELTTQTCTFSTGFFSRPFKEWTFVLNPDRAAVLQVSHWLFAENPQEHEDELEPDTLHTAQLLHKFESIEYPFETAPDQLEVSSSSSVRKVEELHALDLFDENEGLSPFSLGFIFSQGNVPEADSKQTLQTLALAAPDDESRLIAAMMSTDDAGFYKLRTGDRPVRRVWHERYQQNAEDKEAVRAEYETMAAAEPDNVELASLVVNTLPEEEKADALQSLVRRYPAYAAAHYELARLLHEQGNFENAAAAYEQAVAAHPNDPARFAAGKQVLGVAGDLEGLEKLIDWSRSQPEEEVPAFSRTLLSIRVAGLQDDKAKAEAAVAAYEQQFPDEAGTVNTLRQIAAAALGDADTYLQMQRADYGEEGQPAELADLPFAYRIPSAIVATVHGSSSPDFPGETLDAAAAVVREINANPELATDEDRYNEYPMGNDDLLLAGLLAHLLDRPEDAALLEEAAVTSYRATEQPEVVSGLKDAVPSMDWLRRLSLRDAEKAMVIATVAMNNESLRDEGLELAERLAYDTAATRALIGALRNAISTSSSPF